ncbi:MAG: hypothetical protein AB8G05_10945 [Oligoflexales bacterium]
MKLLSCQFFLLFLYFFVFHFKGQAQGLQVPGELAKGNSDIISPQPEHAIFYNPASLHIPITAYSLGISYNLLGRNANALAKKISTLKNDKQRQIEEVEKLIGKPLHLSSFLSVSLVKRPHSGLGFYIQTLADSIVRGRILPILDMNLIMRSGFIVPFARPFMNQQIVLGLALKPSYKFEHEVHRDAFEIFEDRGIIKPTNSGKEGFGLGLDLGLLMVKRFVNQVLKLGGSIRNVGGLSYKKVSYLAAGKSSPSMDKPLLALGGNFQHHLYAFCDLDLIGHYAYLWDKGENYTHSTSNQYGLSLALLNKSIELSAGKYKNLDTYGFKLSVSFLSIFYGYYNSVGDGTSPAPKGGRHFVQMTSSW